MAKARLTIVGLYNHDKTLFDGLVLPDGVDKSTAVNRILRECCDFELIFPDLDFMKYQIAQWGVENAWTFQRWKKAIDVEYNPLHNYDRKEVVTEDIARNDEAGRTLSGSYDESGRTSDEVVSDVSAFDSGDYSPANKTNTSGTSVSNTTRTDVETSSLDSTTGRTMTTENSGNIGVTSSQQLLESEIKVAEWSIYSAIARRFAKDFCIQLY